MGKKYVLTGETKEYEGKTLYRIQAIHDFGGIKSGDLGGWIESEENLSQANDCWLFSGVACDNAKIFGNARVTGSELRDCAMVYGNTLVIGSCLSGNAKIFGGEVQHATVSGHAQIYDHAKILGIVDAEDLTIIDGDAEIYDHAIIHFQSQINGKAKIHGEAEVFGKVSGKAEITGNARYMSGMDGELNDGKLISIRHIYA